MILAFPSRQGFFVLSQNEEEPILFLLAQLNKINEMRMIDKNLNFLCIMIVLMNNKS